MKQFVTVFSLLFLLTVGSIALAQAPATVVTYREARSWEGRETLELPATVESPLETIVAAEVPGMVTELGAREGDRVKKGDLLARLRPTYYELQREQALAALVEAQARLDLASRNRQRADELFSDKVISQQEFDNAISELQAWQGRVAQNQSSITQLDLALKLLQIRAPFSGVVTSRLTQVGRWLTEGGEVAGLVSRTKLEMRVDVPERYFGSLKAGTPAEIHIDALNGSWSGKISRIVPRTNGESRTFPVLITFNKSDDSIGIGMLGRVALPLGRTSTQTTVPKDAVVRSDGSNSIFVLRDDSSVEMVPVTTGSGNADWVAVRGDVQPGDRVITRGNERLQSGQIVQASPQ
jgi:RND family efflux transporter MFP subunit